MRISDWSSDVCSSDLDPGSADPTLARLERDTQRPGRPLRRFRTTRCRKRRYGDRAPVTALAHARRCAALRAGERSAREARRRGTGRHRLCSRKCRLHRREPAREAPPVGRSEPADALVAGVHDPARWLAVSPQRQSRLVRRPLYRADAARRHRRPGASAMVALRSLLAATALAAAAPAHADPVDRWRSLIAEASARFGVPQAWIERVMRAESRGRTTLAGRPITSRAGAMGLMQPMPATWAEMRARLGLGGNPHDPRDNILAGTFYLRLMYERFGYPGLFGAYNAGPGRYAAYAAGHGSLPTETHVYLASVTGNAVPAARLRSEEHTSELQSLMRISCAV